MFCCACKLMPVSVLSLDYVVDKNRLLCVECVEQYLDHTRIALLDWLGEGTETTENKGDWYD